jgi:hypothetical protein
LIGHVHAPSRPTTSSTYSSWSLLCTTTQTFGSCAGALHASSGAADADGLPVAAGVVADGACETTAGEDTDVDGEPGAAA